MINPEEKLAKKISKIKKDIIRIEQSCEKLANEINEINNLYKETEHLENSHSSKDRQKHLEIGLTLSSIIKEHEYLKYLKTLKEAELENLTNQAQQSQDSNAPQQE